MQRLSHIKDELKILNELPADRGHTGTTIMYYMYKIM